MLGPWINSVALIVGSGIGAGLSRWVPKQVREALPLSCGIISAGIGTVMINKIQTIPAVTLSLLLGAFIGEMLFLERRLEQLIAWLQEKSQKLMPTRPDDMGAKSFVLKYITLLVLFCVSGMGIFGSMHEGMTGEASILLTKSILDFFTAIIFATELGLSVVLIALPQIAVQGLLYSGASLLVPYLTPAMQADFSACGGIIMLATGMRICGIKLFPIVNMLPSLLIVMPVSAVWILLAG